MATSAGPIVLPDLSSSSSSSLHLNYPSTTYGSLSSRSIVKVAVHPAALFSILDHYLRRNDPKQPAVASTEEGAEVKDDNAAATDVGSPSSTNVQPSRVIGTLLGVHTDNEVEIRSCFAVPHNESEKQVQLDTEYYKDMIDLHQKVNPEEVIVGWYATSPNLNAYSALLQDFFTKESAPHQAVHLTIDTDLRSPSSSSSSKEPLGVRAYVSSPLGLTPKTENSVFLPLPVTLLSNPTERPALSLLASQTSSTSQTPGGVSNVGQVLPDLTALTQALQQIQEQLRRVLVYVRDVLQGKIPGDEVVGRYLLDTIAGIPVGASNSSSGIGNGAATAAGAAGSSGGGETTKEIGEVWNSCLQDVLMVSYLSNIVRAQAEVAGRLSLLS